MDLQTKQILTRSGEPDRALQDFEEFLLAYQKENKKPFDLKSEGSKKLLTIFGNSHFLSHFLLRHPQEADRVIQSKYLEKEKSLKDFQKDLHSLFPNLSKISEKEFGKKIRHYKYCEFLRLTAKDLSQPNKIESVLNELSFLAISITEYSFQFLNQRLEKELGKPSIDEKDRKVRVCSFCVIAQGKLGGNELNYSSDIDLQYIYESDTGGVKGEKDLTNHEFFVKLAKNLSHFLSEKTEEGFLYRVDLNLRPEGKSGALANSLSALENYYETFGENWEKQALIKANPIAGDLKLGEKFKELIHPFVWRKSFDIQSIEKFKEMKSKLHDEVKKSSAQGFHVKLGEGGIREVEFFVQILQLLYGGKHPELQTPSTLKALEQLVNLKLIPPKEAGQLKEAYLFLRQVEHRLQMVNETQTHLISPNLEQQKALARRMNYWEEDIDKALEHFLNDLSRQTTLVKTMFQSLLSSNE